MASTPEGMEPAGTGPERRVNPAQLALVLGGLLLVLVLLWFFVLRSDGDAEDAAVAPAPVTEETPEPEATTEAPTKQSPVETFEVFAPKDPFDPLISASAGGSDGTGSATATTISSGTGTSAPTTGTTATSTGTTTTTTSNGASEEENVGGHRVRVVDVVAAEGERRAQIQVDGTVYTVDEGERFASNFQLLSTSGRCATMLYGDDEFTLCEGEEILK